MQVIALSQVEAPQLWLEQIKGADWSAAQFLYHLVASGTLYSTLGEGAEVMLLVEGEALLSFCTLAPLDDIQPTTLSPWIGFVYTAPAHRGRGCARMLIEACLATAKSQGHTAVYISTNHIGLYERYGFTLYDILPDMSGDPSRVYQKKL